MSSDFCTTLYNAHRKKYIDKYQVLIRFTYSVCQYFVRWAILEKIHGVRLESHASSCYTHIKPELNCTAYFLNTFLAISHVKAIYILIYLHIPANRCIGNRIAVPQHRTVAILSLIRTRHTTNVASHRMTNYRYRSVRYVDWPVAPTNRYERTTIMLILRVGRPCIVV